MLEKSVLLHTDCLKISIFSISYCLPIFFFLLEADVASIKAMTKDLYYTHPLYFWWVLWRSRVFSCVQKQGFTGEKLRKHPAFYCHFPEQHNLPPHSAGNFRYSVQCYLHPMAAHNKSTGWCLLSETMWGKVEAEMQDLPFLKPDLCCLSPFILRFGFMKFKGKNQKCC